MGIVPPRSRLGKATIRLCRCGPWGPETTPVPGGLGFGCPCPFVRVPAKDHGSGAREPSVVTDAPGKYAGRNLPLRSDQPGPPSETCPIGMARHARYAGDRPIAARYGTWPLQTSRVKCRNRVNGDCLADVQTDCALAGNP